MENLSADGSITTCFCVFTSASQIQLVSYRHLARRYVRLAGVAEVALETAYTTMKATTS